MPEPEIKVHDGMSTGVKWLIGGVGAGLVMLGAYVGSMLKEGTARDDKVREYLQQEIDKQRTERVEFAKAFHSVAESNTKLGGAIDKQTELLGRKFDILINDQRHLPAIRDAYKSDPKPE